MNDMGAVFDALGSATRRAILDIVKNHPGCAIGAVASEFDTTRIAVMRHIRILEDADLLISQKDGRNRRLYHNPVPIQLIYDRWTTEYSSLWAGRMTDVKYSVESEGTATQGNAHGKAKQAGLKGDHPGKNGGRVA